MTLRRATALVAVVLVAAACSGGGSSSSGAPNGSNAGSSSAGTAPAGGPGTSTGPGRSPGPGAANSAGGGSAPSTSVFSGGINGPVAPGSTASATRTQQVCDGAPLDVIGRVLGGPPTALPPVESSGAGFYVTCAWGAGAATLNADYALAADASAADRDWTALKAALGPSAQPVAGVGDEALAPVTATMFGARSGLATLRMTVANAGTTPAVADLATIANGVLRAGG